MTRGEAAFRPATGEPLPPSIVFLSDLGRRSLAIAGGKGANLGELLHAGLPVPPAFCLTTAAYAEAAAVARLDEIVERLNATAPSNTARLQALAASARQRLLAAPVPEATRQAIRRAYAMLSSRRASDAVPVAVRSSATAEDLPEASFAGQQETYLNVVGAESIVDAVRRCWASLWSERAVVYRAWNGIDQRTVRLAVVVQELIQASVAGVLFTANPVTGRRRQAVIDASFGLGEAVVSGAVTPDHFVVDTADGAILERRLGDKRRRVVALPAGGTRLEEEDRSAHTACLSDEQLRRLAQLGVQVEVCFGTPQDIEWALDSGGAFWLLQARPITTLFPLPANAPTGDDLRVYFSFNVAQGVLGPITPMGRQAFRLMGSGLAALVGRPVTNPLDGPASLVEAAERIFLDLTPLLQNPLGQRLIIRALQNMEARSAAMIALLSANPRVLAQARRAPLWQSMGAVLTLTSVLMRTRILPRTLWALVRPDSARARAQRAAAEALALSHLPPEAGPEEHLRTVERLLLKGPPHFGPYVIPVVLAGIGSWVAAGALLAGIATAGELQAISRGLPHNPTTAMDLDLWALAQRVRADERLAHEVRATPPEQLAHDYLAGRLPPVLQDGLASFLRRYGHRGVGEVDLGLPRWVEDPAYLLAVLAGSLLATPQTLAPDAQFRKAQDEASAVVDRLVRRARATSRWRGWLVRVLLSRARALAGQREAPKFYAVQLLARARLLLKPVGDALATTGRLERPDDIFSLTLPEAHAALAGADLRPLVRERRAAYAREQRRRHVPRVLLSDGTEPAAAASWSSGASQPHVLQGTPASAGVVTAHARVVLDPHGAHLEPGEILVAPSTDPGWTPLFLTAAGLVMEMGGPMSHGAVVAREYGIPAVVGVPSATQQIVDGQLLTLDGGAGTVVLHPAIPPGAAG